MAAKRRRYVQSQHGKHTRDGGPSFKSRGEIVTSLDVSETRASAQGQPSQSLPRNPCIELSEFACGLDYADIPDDVVEKEKIHLLDALGNGLCGSASDFGRMVIQYLSNIPSRPEAVVWGTDIKI